MLVENNVPLQPYNTFHIVAKAQTLIRVKSEADVAAALAAFPADPAPGSAPRFFVLGGGSNIVLTGDVKAVTLKVEILGCRLLREDEKAWIVEAGAGERWHDVVDWTLRQGWPGLENLALIPGTIGAAPVQNIGAYGVELQDRFESLDAIDLQTGRLFTLNAAQCGFGYRDSVFKHGAGAVGNAVAEQNGSWEGFGLKDRALITRVRLRLPKDWKPDLGYLDLQRKQAETGVERPTSRQIFDWVCDIRRAKLPDPDVIGNAGSFFKNPTVTPDQCADIIAREPNIVHYPMPDGTVKLAAGWLIDACGWKGKSIGQAGVYEKQALVLVNRGGEPDLGNPATAAVRTGEVARAGATGGEVMTLARAIQTSVYERFGIRLEPEPVVI